MRQNAEAVARASGVSAILLGGPRQASAGVGRPGRAPVGLGWPGTATWR